MSPERTRQKRSVARACARGCAKAAGKVLGTAGSTERRRDSGATKGHTASSRSSSLRFMAFTAGFDTRDLKQAKALMDELSPRLTSKEAR